jgi:hypothetical protein
MKTALIAILSIIIAALVFVAGLSLGGYMNFLGNVNAVSVIDKTVIDAAERSIQIEQLTEGKTEDLIKGLNLKLTGDILTIDLLLSSDVNDQTRKTAMSILARIGKLRKKHPVKIADPQVEAKIKDILENAIILEQQQHNQASEATSVPAPSAATSSPQG